MRMTTVVVAAVATSKVPRRKMSRMRVEFRNDINAKVAFSLCGTGRRAGRQSTMSCVWRERIVRGWEGGGGVRNWTWFGRIFLFCRGFRFEIADSSARILISPLPLFVAVVPGRNSSASFCHEYFSSTWERIYKYCTTFLIAISQHLSEVYRQY